AGSRARARWRRRTNSPTPTRACQTARRRQRARPLRVARRRRGSTRARARPPEQWRSPRQQARQSSEEALATRRDVTKSETPEDPNTGAEGIVDFVADRSVIVPKTRHQNETSRQGNRESSTDRQRSERAAMLFLWRLAPEDFRE